MWPCSRKVCGAAETERRPGHLAEVRRMWNVVQDVTGEIPGTDHTRPPKAV